jgi:hypothetical protein
MKNISCNSVGLEQHAHLVDRTAEKISLHRLSVLIPIGNHWLLISGGIYLGLACLWGNKSCYELNQEYATNDQRNQTDDKKSYASD